PARSGLLAGDPRPGPRTPSARRLLRGELAAEGEGRGLGGEDGGDGQRLLVVGGLELEAEEDDGRARLRHGALEDRLRRDRELERLRRAGRGVGRVGGEEAQERPR